MISMDYRLIKYTSSYLTSLTILLDKSFSIENKDKEKLVKWKYFDEYLENKTITYIALDDKNEVISHYTNIPINVVCLDTTFKAMICTDICTDISHRGKGLISKLSSKVYKEVKDNRYDFSLGFSNDEGIRIDRNSINYGYVIVGKFVRYLKLVASRKKTAYNLIPVSSLEGDLYNASSNFLKIRKDSSYLNWRYLKKPNSEYDIFAIQNGNTIYGYVVLRFLENRCYIYDIITTSDDKKHVINILRSIENKAIDHGIGIIIYNVLDNKYWRKLFNRYKYLKKSKNKINYYATVKIHSENIPKDVILNKENWLLMNGDII